MKNISLIINAVLVIAVGILFYLHFSGSKNHVNYALTDTTSAKIPSGEIVYINIDSVYAKYEYFKDQKKELGDKQSKVQFDLNSRTEKLKKSIDDYQYKAQRGLITSSEAQQTEQKLAQDQQTLYQYRDGVTSQLAEEEQVMNRKIFSSIVDFLKEFNKSGKYKYIMSHGFGGNLLYVDPKLDITNVVLVGLNSKYAEDKAKEKK
jgi:outer membrane protein